MANFYYNQENANTVSHHHMGKKLEHLKAALVKS